MTEDMNTLINNAHRAGFVAGYKEGFDDGTAMGYSDARTRAHQAIKIAYVDKLQVTEGTITGIMKSIVGSMC